jgi:PAS domain S-box-containing protein
MEGVSEDITNRKQAEEALRESEQRFNLAIEGTGAGLWDWDMVKDQVVYSAQWKRMLGYEVHEVEDTFSGWKNLWHPEDCANIEKALDDHLAGKTAHYEIIHRLRHKDGGWRWILTRGDIVKDAQGKPCRWVGTNLDITAQKQAEEEKLYLEERLTRSEKMESLGLLAGGVAHDLNNVLGIVVGYAELVLDAIEEKSPLRKDLKTIFDGGQKAAAIVDDLLTLARRGVVGKQVLNLNKLITDFKKSPQWSKLLTYHPHVQISTELDPDLLNIAASSVHLEKTLYNLVSNAAEAMTSGGNINIKTSNQYIDKPISGYDNIHEGDYVVLSVSDEGDGISEIDLKRIFEPFYTKKIMGRSGTGLGLSVVWGTVKDHQGYIDVHSEEGKGTTFILYFLITREDIEEELLGVSMAEYLGNEESILVVDDVKDQRELATRLLKALNYKVSSVASGEEAIKYLKDHQPDLIVLDMIMDPGIDGLDTYKSILEINPKQRAIIVSGFSESDRVKEAKALGAGAYIKKPYIKEKLGLAVKKELARK